MAANTPAKMGDTSQDTAMGAKPLPGIWSSALKSPLPSPAIFEVLLHATGVTPSEAYYTPLQKEKSHSTPVCAPKAATPTPMTPPTIEWLQRGRRE